jgi:hypothetical protein
MFSSLKAFAMILFNQVAAAAFLLSLTLCLQCAGVTTLIEWLRRVLTGDTHKHGPVYAASLAIKSIIAIAILHGLVILVRAGFYRAGCLPFYFCASSYSTVGYGDLNPPLQLATLRAPGGDHRCVDVWNIGQCSVCSRHPVTRSRHTIFADEFKLNKNMPNEPAAHAESASSFDKPIVTQS